MIQTDNGFCPASAPRSWRETALAAAMLCLSVTIPNTPASAQSSEQLRPLIDRMERLERDIRTLNIQVSRGDAAVPPPSGSAGVPTGTSGDYSFARLNVRINALEDELRSMTGTIEGLNHQIRTLSERLDKLVGDVDYRLGALEKQAGRGGPAPAGDPKTSAAPSPPRVESQAPSGPASQGAEPRTLGTLSAKDPAAAKGSASAESQPKAQSTSPGSALPPGTPKEQYSYAFGLLRQANYEQAEAALREFIKANPDDPLTGNARYWLGETHYVRAEYLKAAEVFAENYKLDAKGAKAPDTLLKLGMSLANLDKKKQACLTFDELRKRFPDAPAIIKSTAAKERSRAGCK